MKNLRSTFATFAKRALGRKTHSKCILKWFMRTKSPSNVICVIIQLSNMHRLEDTLNVSMKNLSNTNVTFVNCALASKEILKVTSKLCMKTTNLSNVIFVIFQLSDRHTLKSTLNVFMKISSNTCVIFAKRALVIKVHSKCILKGFMKTKSPSNAICVSIQHSKMQTLKNTLIVSMKNSNSINVVFVIRALAEKKILIGM
jgi:hypothetical protein